MNKQVTLGTKSTLWLMGILSLVGLAIAAYLAATYAKNQAPYCAGSGGCESVQTSEYVTIISGLLDVPTLGVIGYIILLALTVLRGRLNEQVAFYLPLLTYGAALIGFFYSAYLTYLEAFAIHAWCYWCLVSAVLSTIIFMLSVVDLHRAWFEA
jgi:uncharacterized membrane protein